MIDARNSTDGVVSAVATASRRRLRRRAWTSSWYSTATIVAIVVVWELACRFFGIGSYLLPTPTDVVKTVVDDPRFLMNHTGATAAATLAGFVLAGGRNAHVDAHTLHGLCSHSSEPLRAAEAR